ncbi:MAG: NusA N-terminal domain-containing protein, partial [Candidatus Binatia bacterium]
MQPDLNRVIEQVSKEKGMDRGVIIEALESAMLAAARRAFGQKRIEAKFNPDIGEVELFEIKTVVDTVTNADTEIDAPTARETLDPEAQVGDELLSKLPPAVAFGRIGAQVAK